MPGGTEIHGFSPMEQMKADGWLGSVLEIPVFRLEPAFGVEGEKVEVRLREVHAGLAFSYAKVPVSDVSSVQWLERSGFHLVDTNITLEKSIRSNVQPIIGNRVRFAEKGDESAVVALAGRAFTLSRFHLDPFFSRTQANAIKSEWVRNFFRGKRGDFMVVSESAEGEITGFNMLLRHQDVLVIDLIAVDEPFRGQSIGKDLIGFSQSTCGEFERFRVGTQIANVASLGLYQKCGFVMTSASYVFHRHSVGGMT